MIPPASRILFIHKHGDIRMGIYDVIAFCLLSFISGIAVGSFVQEKTDLDREREEK